MNLNILGVILVSLFWSVGGPLAWIATQEVAPAVATAGRCAFAFLALFPVFILWGAPILVDRALPFTARASLAASGLVLGIHFYLFVCGVTYASLTTAVSLVAVEPALVLLVGVVIFKERLRTASAMGILICMAGIGAMSVWPHLNAFLSADSPLKPGRLFGDACAVVAVLFYALYYGLNRSFRPYESKLLPQSGELKRGLTFASIIYFFATLSSGAILIFLIATDRADWVAPSTKTWAALVGMGWIPTLLGHTLNQVVSRKAHPVWVSLMSPGETLFALFLGVFFLKQGLEVYELVGAATIFAGVLTVIWSEARPVVG